MDYPGGVMIIRVFQGGFPSGSDGKASACNMEDWGSIPGWKDPLEKEMATHSRILAWKIPWTKEPGGLHSPWGSKESDTTEQLHFPGRQECQSEQM